MRRLGVSLSALIALLLVVSACAAEPVDQEDAAQAEIDDETEVEEVEDIAADAEPAEARTIPIVDDVGRIVDVPSPVERAIAFNTRNIEFVRSVGAMDRIVALPERQEDEYWPEMADAPRVSSEDWERIVEIDPQVVIYARNGPWEAAIEQLGGFGIEIVVLTGWDMQAHEHTVSTMGAMFDQRAEAEAVNEFFFEYANLISERLEDVPAVPVYLENHQDFRAPIPGSGWHDMVELGGGMNIFEDIRFERQQVGNGGSVHAFPIEPEAIVLREPEVVVKLFADHGYEPPEPGALEALRDELMARPGWDTIPAVQNDRVYVFTGFPGNASSKIVGAIYVAKWVYPEVFEDIDPDEVHRQWVEEFQGVPLPEPEAYRTSL